MTNFANTFSTKAVAALLTVVFSAVTVLGAVGPAYTGKASSHAVMAQVEHVPGKSANTLA